jgi:uncharacterized membrane protein (UPF0127 family)
MYWKYHSKETDPKVALKKYTQFIDPQLIEILIGDHLFDMEVSSDHSVGLSQRKKMNCEGMIFILDEVRDAQFHMKDCYFPLDIIFCKDGAIKKISENCPPCNSDVCEKYSCEEVDLVIELPAGTCSKLNIVEGGSCQVI